MQHLQQQKNWLMYVYDLKTTVNFMMHILTSALHIFAIIRLKNKNQSTLSMYN